MTSFGDLSILSLGYPSSYSTLSCQIKIVMIKLFKKPDVNVSWQGNIFLLQNYEMPLGLLVRHKQHSSNLITFSADAGTGFLSAQYP